MRKISRVFGYGILAVILGSCSGNEHGKDKLFSKLPVSSTNISFTNQLTDRGDLNIIEYLYYYNGGGAAVGDLNNDGLEDLVFTGNQVDNEVYFNQGNLAFDQYVLPYPEEEKAGKWSTGVTLVDINADGFLDIYICQVGNYKSLKGRNLLYINNQDGSFKEDAERYGLDFTGYSTHAAFFDYDLDGDLDMYLLNHSIHTPRSYKPAESRIEFDSLAGDRLFENRKLKGKTVFADVTKQAGIYSSSLGYGLGLVVSDINMDGWPDVYVGNDFHENDYLYINNQDGTFREQLKDRFQHTSRFTMGVDIADLSGDAFPEVVGLDMLPADPTILMKSGGEDANKVAEIKRSFGYHEQVARNVIQLNDRQGNFSDIALMTGLHATDWSWSALINDFDNDGLNDLFISNGIYKRPNDLDYIKYVSNTNFNAYTVREQDSIEQTLIAKMPQIKIPNYIFKNMGGMKFEEVSDRWGLGEETYSNGTVYADLDQDGDLEIIINNVNETASVYENHAADSVGNFLQVSLLGEGENPQAIGARVLIYLDSSRQLKEQFPVRGFQSSVSPTLHFGLGSRSTIDSLFVVWPGNTVSVLRDIPVNRNLTISIDSAGAYKVENLLTSPEPLSYSIEKLDFIHREDKFQDYDREALIPHKISIEGPSVSASDIDGNGLDDIFVGGAHNQAAVILKQSSAGVFRKEVQAAFEKDAGFEDVASVFFDADNDGDLDLYVAAGGGYYPEKSALLQDRLYSNDNGRFSRVEVLLPRTNASTVASGDFDEDGDVDLFVGSYTIPGSYGVAPASYFLINNGDFDFTMSEVMMGMVRDAAWGQVLGDEKYELVIAGEFLPVQIFTFDKNGWLNLTDSLNLQYSSGWWSDIELADLDNDGKSEIIAGNLGLNSKLTASEEKPVKLYVGDFDNNGQIDPLLFYHKSGVSIPFMTKDELVSQLPSLRKDFLSYQEYSTVNSLEELIQGLPGKRYKEWTAYKFAHAVFDFGDSNYAARPLPTALQRSTLNAIAVGETATAYGGNFFGAVSSFGRYDAGGLFITKGERVIQIPEFNNMQVRDLHWISDQLLLVAVNNDTLRMLTLRD